MYYDLRNQRALANNVVLKSFDPIRNMPIYVRAKQLRQMARRTFEAEDVALTSSEFWTPQISLEAAKIRIIDKRRRGAGRDSPRQPVSTWSCGTSSSSSAT